MKILISLFFLLFAFSIFISHGQASRSPEAPKCYFIGEVIDVIERVEIGKGISEGEEHKYIDVTIHKIRTFNKNESFCSSEETQTFQVYGSILGVHNPSLPNKKDCIKGYSQFMADGNFMSGNWLTVDNILPADACR